MGQLVFEGRLALARMSLWLVRTRSDLIVSVDDIGF